jgi:hypothetical protein
VFGDDDIIPYLPENVRPFAHLLKQFPANFEKWVFSPTLPSRVFQGDLFSDVPFVSVDEQGEIIRAEWRGMVISNTCDAQPDQGEFVLVAPVLDLKDYQQKSDLKGEELDNHIRAIAENKISNLMFLPSYGSNNPDSFVDFGNVCSVSNACFHLGSQKRIASLSQVGHYFLLVKLAYHLTRPESADAVRSTES